VKKYTKYSVLAAGAAFALLLTACSSSTPTSAPSSQAPAPATTAAADPATTPAETPPADDTLFSQLPQEIQDAGVIVIASPMGNIPQIFKDTDGNLTGIVPDLAKLIEPILGVTLEFQETAFPTLMQGLAQGEYPVVWGVITDTTERQATYDFVDFQEDGALLSVLRGNPEGITGIDESLCGLSVSAQAGSFQLARLNDQKQACADAGLPELDVQEFAEIPPMITALQSGNVHAAMAGLGPALYRVEHGGDGNTFDIAGPVYDSTYLGVAFAKGSPLVPIFQEAIKQIVTDGSYQAVFDSYGLGDSALTVDEIMINGATF
jgi:polar amino acid transport system substrate-binding protein